MANQWRLKKMKGVCVGSSTKGLDWPSSTRDSANHGAATGGTADSVMTHSPANATRRHEIGLIVDRIVGIAS